MFNFKKKNKKENHKENRYARVNAIVDKKGDMEVSADGNTLSMLVICANIITRVAIIEGYTIADVTKDIASIAEEMYKAEKEGIDNDKD